MKNDEFKSYYVVWKLQKIQLDIQTHQSLNRTMQYGNLQVFHYFFYYFWGLNRTMQYGNRGKRIWDIGNRKFKSYYVVWKLVDFFERKRKTVCLNRTMQYGNKILHRQTSLSQNV